MNETEGKIQEVLAQIRPTLQKDGGDVEFVSLEPDNTLQVRLTGACKGCPMSQVTLKQGIEKYVISEIPAIQAVVAVD